MKDSTELAGVALDGRQGLDSDLGVSPVDLELEIPTDVLDDGLEIDRLEWISSRFDSGVLQ